MAGGANGDELLLANPLDTRNLRVWFLHSASQRNQHNNVQREAHFDRQSPRTDGLWDRIESDKKTKWILKSQSSCSWRTWPCWSIRRWTRRHGTTRPIVWEFSGCAMTPLNAKELFGCDAFALESEAG